jgi:IS5 family transposase
VIVDTTVMPKAVAHPTDSRLLETSRQHLVTLAEEEGLTLRQNYNREAPRLAAQIGRYAHAKQYRRIKKSLRTLRSRVGRVMRDVGRQLERIDPSRQDRAREILDRANRILTQQTKDKNKLYAFHAPEVAYISKGKARTPYKFGVKVTVATTLKEGFVVGMRSLPGNPYDGHTLAETIEQVSILADRAPKTVIVDRGYRAVELDGIQILRSGQKRGITRTLHAMIKRKSAIEPTIGHMKTDGLTRTELAQRGTGRRAACDAVRRGSHRAAAAAGATAFLCPTDRDVARCDGTHSACAGSRLIGYGVIQDGLIIRRRFCARRLNPLKSLVHRCNTEYVQSDRSNRRQCVKKYGVAQPSPDHIGHN